ncbi:WD repeat-containing protein 18 [Aplysia californica]|uniref:WD repeat-containing protein 18 n=1 Tax=Aplysia californica TaxID=6500 RepID=A0ABM1A3A4_APLCA|nr:WD repeat-containing protein 18 [Aplysia californica]
MATSSKVNTLRSCEEVVFVSTKSSEEGSWNVASWDARTGNLLQTHRHGSSSPHTLCMLNGECILAASHSKPVIHVWNMLRQGQKHRKLICGAKIAALATSPDNNWIAAGMEDKIYIWQVCTGNLYSVLSHSSVEVKCLKFTPSGQHLVSAYKDGSVCVWELQDAVTLDPHRINEVRPVNTFFGHSGEVTDLHISLSNTVVTCGTDFSVRVWSLFSSEELKMFELGTAVTSVVMDHSELTLYAGDANGNVFSIDLHHKPAVRSVHLDVREPSDGFIVYPAHSAAVRRLCLSQDNVRIVSASDDMTVKIWSLISTVHPITIDLNEQVCDLLVTPVPAALVNPDAKPRVFLSNLKRNIHEVEADGAEDEIFIDIPVKLPQVSKPQMQMPTSGVEETSVTMQGNNSSLLKKHPDVVSLKDKANKLKKANEEIYQFALKEIIK